MNTHIYMKIQPAESIYCCSFEYVFRSSNLGLGNLPGALYYKTLILLTVAIMYL